MIAAGLLTYLAVRHRDQDSLAAIRPIGIPASVSTPLANLMGLSPVPARPAPGFTLTDQDGRTPGQAPPAPRQPVICGPAARAGMGRSIPRTGWRAGQPRPRRRGKGRG